MGQNIVYPLIESSKFFFLIMNVKLKISGIAGPNELYFKKAL